MEKIIELESNAIIDERKNSTARVLFWVVSRLIMVGVFLTAWVYASLWTAKTYERVSYNMADTIINYKYKIYSFLDIQDAIALAPKNGEQMSGNLDDLIDKYSAKYRINPAIAKALIDQESGFKPDRIRFEQKWKTQYSKKYPKPAYMTDIEYDLHFSSIGIMQIGYILHKDTCGLNSYTDLLFPEKSIDCAMKILSICLEDSKEITSPSRRLRTCIKSYNGSGPSADAYTEDVMSKIEDYLISNSKTDLLVFSQPLLTYATVR